MGKLLQPLGSASPNSARETISHGSCANGWLGRRETRYVPVAWAPRAAAEAAAALLVGEHSFAELLSIGWRAPSRM